MCGSEPWAAGSMASTASTSCPASCSVACTRAPMKPAAPVSSTLTALIEGEGVSLHAGIGREADRHALILRLFEQCVKSRGPVDRHRRDRTPIYADLDVAPPSGHQVHLFGLKIQL